MLSLHSHMKGDTIPIDDTPVIMFMFHSNAVSYESRKSKARKFWAEIFNVQEGLRRLYKSPSSLAIFVWNDFLYVCGTLVNSPPLSGVQLSHCQRTFQNIQPAENLKLCLNC